MRIYVIRWWPKPGKKPQVLITSSTKQADLWKSEAGAEVSCFRGTLEHCIQRAFLEGYKDALDQLKP